MSRINQVEISIVKAPSIEDIEADWVLLKNVTGGLIGPEAVIDHASYGGLRKYNSAEKTKVGTVEILSNIPGIAANGIILVGVGSPISIGYETIDMMCQKAIDVLAKSGNSVKSLATVSHAVGFGLSLRQVFRSQLFAFRVALQNHPELPNLEKIIFNEIVARNYIALLTFLDELVDTHNSPIKKIEGHYFLKVWEDSPLAERFSSQIREHRYIFVAMPFSSEFDNVYDFGIVLPAEESGLLPIRTDRKFFSGSIVEEIKSRIRDSVIVLADISQANPNVLFELGYAQGQGKPTIIICRNGDDFPFDVRGMNIISYDPNLIRNLKSAIIEAIIALAVNR